MQTNEKIRVLGLMSGTSLDGLDLAHCEFRLENGKWTYEITAADTIKYDAFWFETLSNIHLAKGLDYVRTDQSFGRLLGKLSVDFIKANHVEPDFISSHGHTVFHQPTLGFTGQIGCGASMHAITDLPVVSDFRTVDVALGGQGAPLVPIGDKLLFLEYEFCLNLGGISNVSFDSNDHRIAYDICPVNQVLNYLSKKLGKEYDEGGNFAKQGNIDLPLLKKLNDLAFYDQPFPKSLGREWVEAEVMPLLNQSALSIPDQLATFIEHIALQIATVINHNSQRHKNNQILCTGGGTFNVFLIERMKVHLLKNCELVIPEASIINFKEAIIFAFLGLLRVLNQPNGLKSVTGARKDSVGGALYGDFQKLFQKMVAK